MSDEDLTVDYLIRSGQTKELNTRTYRFSSFIIEAGGTLVVQERSRQWCMIQVDGNLRVNGNIVCKSFLNGPRNVSDTTPSGRTIEHEYRNDFSGGDGGSGGSSDVQGANRTGRGGRGAVGSIGYGGGGGSGGGGRTAGSIREVSDGNDAVQWRGGVQAQWGSSIGGDGGHASDSANGGLIYIFAGGFFDGAGGKIDIRGKNGESGINGTGGGTSGWRNLGGGGGGGGAPGGEGGRLIVDSQDIRTYPVVLLDGGRGGDGGQAGASPRGATNGRRGSDGPAGFEDYGP